MSKKCGLGKFVFGVGLGVGLGLLFAPQEGSKTRKELKVKLDELVDKIKEIDPEDVKADILQKVEELRMELSDLDKEKALAIAKSQAKKVGKKAEELAFYAKEKGTPVVEAAAEKVKSTTLKAAKEVVNRLEESEKNESKQLVKKNNNNKNHKKPNKKA